MHGRSGGYDSMIDFFEKTKGSISLFLALIMLPMMTVAGLIVDGARISAAKASLSGAGDLAMNAALSEYDQILYDVYGIFAVSENMEELQNNVSRYFANSIDNTGILNDSDSYTREFINSIFSSFSGDEMEFNNIVDLKADRFTLQGVESSAIGNPKVLERQIVDYMKYRGPINIGKGLLTKLGCIGETSKQTKAIEAKVNYDQKLDTVQDACKEAYAAPEQFGGMGQTDARTDIYCLGATLYHLVTGCNPSEPPYEMKPIREINPSLSGGLERIILKCTQRNPEDRYQSAAELMYALDHYKEIDEDYKKKQKRKLAKFIVPTALAVVFAVAGFALSHVAAQQATDTYRDILYEASKTADYGEKVALYGEAIAVPDKAGEKDAYLALIQTYKDNDSRFSVEEANQLTKYIKSNKAALQADPANYTEICFETGKLYWYYYDYGDGTDNQVTRAKSAVEWFQDVLDNAPEGYANLNMARVYVNIGSFYRDITTDITEASDKGKYKPFFDNIRELLDTVATDENESEIVRLELLELSRSALQQYATKFKGDGISQADMMQMYDQVERTVTGISATADTTEHKKEATVSLLADTKKAIETAYATKGGKQA